MLSIHENFEAPKCKEGWLSPFEDDAKFWLPHQIERAEATLDNIEWAIGCYTWSCSIYAGGVRNSANFLRAAYVALDFDEGKTLDWALHTFAAYACVIGTTKSHQVAKGGVVADRFRVLLRLSEVVTDADVYQRTAKTLIARYGSDRACSDPARIFYHCPQTVYAGPEDGDTIQPAPPPAPVRRLNAFKTLTGRLPQAISRYQQGGGFMVGQRNVLIYQAACDYRRLLKLTLNETLATMRPYTDEDERRFTDTVKSAFKDAP